MTLRMPTLPITSDDATIAAAVADAPIGALLPAVAHVTGDRSMLRDDLRPNADDLFDPEGNLTQDQRDEARRLAAEALGRWRDAGCPTPVPATDDELHELMAFCVGPHNLPGYEPVLREEFALEGEDLRAPGWRKEDVAPDVAFTVAIVGAGMSGIVAAHRLQQAGVPFVVFEKNDDVGGTWLENTYPGCRVDVANNLYSYSFAQTTWPQLFSTQDVLLDYFRRCADDLGIRPHIRFGTEVLEATFDEDDATWTVRVRSAEGVEETHRVQALISAVGQLNRPKLPDIDGVGDFAGPAFHSARWDHSVDLAGKRVAVIGTGASAMQLIPAIAGEVGHLTVFQRTPAWLAPSADYLQPVPDGMRWLIDHVPGYGQWYRLFLFWRNHEGLLPACEVDPDWDQGERSVSAANDLVRMVLTAYIEEHFADRPDLLAKVIPQYPPVSKRIIRDDGSWARALKRDDVELVTTGIERIESGGVRTTDGVLHEVDVIVYGTGFTASQFLTPMRVVGRSGVELHDRWAGDARAYLGLTVPGFPNLFVLYGPNTNIVINGSIIYFSELEVRYLVELIHQLLASGHRAADVRPEVHDAFNDEVDAANRRMTWGWSQVNSWYKNEHGRVAQNWPFSLLEYWQRTRHPDLDDYALL